MEKIIIEKIEAEEFLLMLFEAAEQTANPKVNFSTTKVIENIANDFRDLCKL